MLTQTHHCVQQVVVVITLYNAADYCHHGWKDFVATVSSHKDDDDDNKSN